MTVWPTDGSGGFLDARVVRRVRCELVDAVTQDDPVHASGVTARVFVDAANSSGAFEVPAGSRVQVGGLSKMQVRSCKRCCGANGRVHHWELGLS